MRSYRGAFGAAVLFASNALGERGALAVSDSRMSACGTASGGSDDERKHAKFPVSAPWPTWKVNDHFRSGAAEAATPHEAPTGDASPANPNGHILLSEEVEATMPKTSGPDAESLLARPEGLVAWRFDVGGEAFALLESGDPPPDIPFGLTKAEADVARLAVQGLSNKQIAVRRGTSARTVANQMASLFRKLGLASRPELLARLRREVTGRR